MWKASPEPLICVPCWMDVNRRGDDLGRNRPQKYRQNLCGFQLDKLVLRFGCTDDLTSEQLAWEALDSLCVP